MATVPAIVGTARLGNFRLGYESAALATRRRTKVRLLLAGTDVRVRVAGLTIRDVLNETPNTAAGTINSPAPSSGQALRITINSDTPRLLFAGAIQTDDLTYEGKPTQLAYPFTAIDDTARLNKRRPVGTWTTISATTVAQALVSGFAPGFSSAGIAASLPLVTITFDGSTSFMGCLARLATLIGGYCNAEDGIVYLFLTDATDPPDAIDSTPGRFLDDPPIQASRDDSQLATRVYGKGHAEAVPIDVAIGETIVPLADSVMYNPAGGKVIASTTPDGVASEILTYTGVQLGGAGSLAGPGVVPSVAPNVTLATGTGVETGVHLGAYTFVTAAGETLPSPTRSIYVGPVADPTVAEVIAAFPVAANSNLTIGATYRYQYTMLGGVGETLPSPASNAVVAVDNGHGVAQALWGTSQGFGGARFDSNGILRTTLWYRSVNGGAYRLVPNLGSLDTTYSDANVAGNQQPPVSNSTTGNKIDISGIAIGPTGTTQRKYYRTVAGGAQLKLQQTIANNTATVGVTDATADASLGANAPTSDTSGLVQTFGQVNAGSTSLPTSGAAPFSATGGWARTSADDLIRYTGITGNTLTGIPATGAGAIITSILWSSQVISASALTGVTGLTKALAKGAPVHLWVQRDDATAQAAAAARESTATYTSDGIHEIVITDERRGEASLTARCDAHLALFANPIVTVTYATRDVKTKSGKPVTITLASPAIAQTLTIQDVTITEIDVANGLAPKFLVTASSVRFSLEDLLRRMNALLES